MIPDAPAAIGRDRSLLRLEDEVGALMRRARRVVAERARLMHPDLQPGAYVVLAQVTEQGPLRAADLCVALGVDKAAVSRQIQHLVEIGLVESTPDPGDGRATLLSASADGRRRLTEVSHQRREFLQERLASWSDADLEDFVAALGRYNATLN